MLLLVPPFTDDYLTAGLGHWKNTDFSPLTIHWTDKVNFFLSLLSLYVHIFLAACHFEMSWILYVKYCIKLFWAQKPHVHVQTLHNDTSNTMNISCAKSSLMFYISVTNSTALCMTLTNPLQAYFQCEHWESNINDTKKESHLLVFYTLFFSSPITTNYDYEQNLILELYTLVNLLLPKLVKSFAPILDFTGCRNDHR